ncbi:alpha/beta fold hydrolase [Microvirga sp. BT689]|uniref:alpha/beta fold hydrolase n=1 Tax=Microvirga arvi TaxID=2778731 RepID=UPI00194F29A9|nr:alpha/beta fold hydrolase [Microvirga arvi]MBM6583142.1 alpha/beta fold hydrolase [Microvirga arvi]
MHFEKQGSGPPVVLIHGIGAYSFSWREMTTALREDHTLYALDLLGFGQSPAPPNFPYTMAAQAEAVSAFIKAQSLINPVLIGHSMGGGVALRIAEQAERKGQPKLERLVLIAPVAYPPPKASLGPDLNSLMGFLGSPDLDLSMISVQLVTQILDEAYADSSLISAKQVDGYAKGLSSRAQLKAFLEHSRRLSEIAVSATDLGNITIPTLVIWGEQDSFLPPSDGRRLKDALGNASLEMIDNCGHIPHEERPAETRALLKNFL